LIGVLHTSDFYIKINYGQIGDQTGLFYTTDPVFYAASDKIYQLLAHGRWFSPASSTTKTARHDIAEILPTSYW
jgi:hypothetical protein